MAITLLIRITGVIIIRIGGRCTSGVVRAFVLRVRFVATVVALIVCLISAVRVIGAAASEVEGVEEPGDWEIVIGGGQI